MRIFIAPALAASLALAGCQTTDSEIQKNLAAACAVVEAANAAFNEITKTFTVEQRYKDSVKVAYDGAHEICLHPETATTITVISRVTGAAISIYAILTQITNKSPAAMQELRATE